MSLILEIEQLVESYNHTFVQEYEYTCILQTDSLYASVSTGVYGFVYLYLSLENDGFLHTTCIQEPNNRAMGVRNDSGAILYLITKFDFLPNCASFP